MTPNEKIISEFGIEAVELLNIARGVSRQCSPCGCSGCRYKLAQISTYLKALRHGEASVIRSDDFLQQCKMLPTLKEQLKYIANVVEA